MNAPTFSRTIFKGKVFFCLFDRNGSPFWYRCRVALPLTVYLTHREMIAESVKSFGCLPKVKGTDIVAF